MHKTSRGGCLFCLGVAFWTAVDLPVAAPPKEGEAWLRTATPHFTLFGNVGDQRLLEVAKQLELFREALQKATVGMAKSSAVETDVFVFKRRESFEAYALDEKGKPKNIVGYFRPAPDRNYITLDLSGPEPPYRIVFHEYVHYVLDNNLPGAPLWLDEGLAEFYSTLAAQPGRNEARLGEPIPEHMAALQAKGLMPVDRLFAVNHDSPEYNEAARQGIFYAESWALVHWLTADDPARRERFNQYVNRLRRGDDARAAFLGALGMDPAAIQAALAEYVRRDALSYFNFRFGAEFAQRAYEAVPITRAEATARLGDLLLHAGPAAFGDAEAHLKLALTLDSAQPAAQLALADLARGREQWDRAAALYEAALPKGGARAAMNYGWMLLDRYVTEHPRIESGATGLPAPIAKARGLFRSALTTVPENGRALHGLARTYLFVDEDLTEGVSAAAKAHELLSGRPDVTLDLIALVAAAGKTDLAATVYEKDLRRETTDPEFYRNAEEAIAFGEVRRAAAAMEGGHPEAARAILEAALARAKDTKVRGELAENLARVNTAAAQDEVIQAWNAASAAAAAGDFAKARDLYAQLATTATNPELKKSAQEMLRRTEAAAAESRAMVRVNKAFTRANLGDVAGAIREIDAILRDEPALAEEFRASLIKDRDRLQASVKKP